MAGETTCYQMVSATLFVAAGGMRSAGLQFLLGEDKPSFEDQLVIQYAGQKGSVKDYLRSLNMDKDMLKVNAEPPHLQISYPYGEPWKMIEAIPRPIEIKNIMEKYWIKGRTAASFVKVILPRANGNFRYMNEYVIGEYDKCTSRWSGNLSELANTHFPVDSENLLRALNDLHVQFQSRQSNSMGWAPHHRHMSSSTLSIKSTATSTEDELDLILCCQCLVLGYWYQLLEPLISIQKTHTDVYLSGAWGFKDWYLLKAIEDFSFHMRCGMSSDDDISSITCASREEMIRLLAAMYAGRQTDVHKPENSRLKTGLLAINGNISIIRKSLLYPTDDVDEIARFSVLLLPILDLLQDRDGELWAGKGTGIEFRLAPKSEIQPLTKVSSKMTWSLHTKRCINNGSPGGIVPAVRCNGVYIGTVNPEDADTAIARGSGWATHEKVNDEPMSGYTITESDFLSGSVLRPFERDAIVLVQSQGNPVMRYAVAGLLYSQLHVLVGSDNLSHDWACMKRLAETEVLDDQQASVILG